MVDQFIKTNDEAPKEVNVIEVPVEHIQKVKEYIASLADDEAEVSGYSFTVASLDGGSKGGGSASRAFTQTGIVATGDGSDEVIADKDRHL